MRPFICLGGLPLPLTLLATLVSAQLGIEVTKEVECTRRTQDGDFISVHYRGTLQTDGTEFDASYNRGAPFQFTLGAGQVIKGWDQGLLGMCIGEGRKLTIPPSLGYGASSVGKIPAGSTLVFETELMGIKGVEEPPPPPPRPTINNSPASTADVASSAIPTSSVTPPLSSSSAPTPTQVAESTPSPTPTGNASPMDADENSGECKLLGSFALLVQGALGLLALSSLVIKRWRETPRRPLKIWFFDVSKQVVGSVLLHLANLLMSMFSAGDFDFAAKAKAAQFVQNDKGEQPNPCSFYLLNLAIDTTIGIPILVVLLKILHRAFLLTPMANPPESIRSGNYGQPARATWWLKQCVIYFLGLIGMKLCVFFIFQLLPWIAWVGDWALRWTEGNEAIQITFVMFIFPLIMNALQYWIIDSFIKDPASGEGHHAIPTNDDSDDESGDEAWLEQRRRRRQMGVDEDSDVEAAEREPLKEANPTAIPVRSNGGKGREYDPATDGASSSSGERPLNSRDKELGGGKK